MIGEPSSNTMLWVSYGRSVLILKLTNDIFFTKGKCVVSDRELNYYIQKTKTISPRNKQICSRE